MLLANLLGSTAARLPKKSSVILGERRLSFCELDLQAKRLAFRLISSGVCPGDRVALHMENGPELAVGYFACFYAGAIAVPTYTQMKPDEINYIIEHSGASICVAPPAPGFAMERLQTRFPCIRQIRIDCHEPEGELDRTRGTLPLLAADRPAVIIYTSGTTARPKGVVHTHSSLLNSSLGFGIDQNDVFMITTPMVHSSGLMALVASVHAGATAITVAAFDAHAVLDAVARYHGTYLFGTPVMYRALISAQGVYWRDVSSLECCIAGADAVPGTVQNAFAQCFGRPLHEGFGTTETGPIAINWSSLPPRVGSFGRALPGVEIAVVGADGHPVPSGEEGEMIVRSASNMAGYWNDKTATENAFRDGWFYTGDLVCADRDGFLWFRGRKKEIIIRGGSNISPQEVEAVLCQHAGVLEAGVVGVPDVIWGERVVAFVARRPAYAITANELIEFTAERLATYKIPADIIVLDDLPKSPAGKIQRRALRTLYLTIDGFGSVRQTSAKPLCPDAGVEAIGLGDVVGGAQTRCRTTSRERGRP